MAVMRRVLLSFVLLAVVLAATPATASTSRCLAVAEGGPPVVPAALRPAGLKQTEVRLTFVGHSTFLIETAGGVRIATDYAGWAGRGVIPDVVTMNHAHETHYTDYPDAKITHVLRGWNPKGGHAEHDLKVGDVHIRSVPTNIRVWGTGETEAFGNSIFIFEVAGLCIGHLGHLQHEPTVQQLGQIGQLDVVLVPVDGVYTMDHAGMVATLKKLQARLIVPMHYFEGFTLGLFLEKVKGSFAVRTSEVPTTVLSRATLPADPQVLVLPGF